MTLISILVGTLVAGMGSVWLAALLAYALLSRFTQHLLSLAAGALLATAFTRLPLCWLAWYFSSCSTKLSCGITGTNMDMTTDTITQMATTIMRMTTTTMQTMRITQRMTILMRTIT
jgi:hypothetical protein